MSEKGTELTGWKATGIEPMPYDIFDEQGRKINPAPWDKTPEKHAASPYQEEPDDLGLEDELAQPPRL